MGTDDRADAPPDVRTMIGMGSASAAEKKAKDEPDPEGSVLGLQVDLKRNVDRASDAILGDTPRGAPAAADEPEVYAPVIPKVPLHRLVVHELDTFFSPPWTKQKKIIMGSAIGSLTFLLVCLFIARGGSSENATATAASASASASAPRVAALRRSLHVTADGPIASITVGERVVDVASPKTSVDVDLLEAEQGKSLHVLVTGKDGRVAFATAEPSTRGLDVALTDEPAALELPAPPPPSASAVHGEQAQALPPPAAPPRRTWPKRGVKK